MDPNVEAIAELFGMSTTEPPSSGKVGRNADESRRLGQDALSDNRYTEALEHFHRALEQNPSDKDAAVIDLAEAYAYGDNEPTALRLYRKAKAAGTASTFGAAEIYKRFGRYADAVAELRKAADAEPENALHRQKLSDYLLQSGYPRAALEAAQEAVALSPSTSYYHFAVAEIQAKLNELQDAIESYRAAIELSPGDDYLYQRLAVAFWKANRKSEAIKAVRLASDLEPEKFVYHGLLMRMLQETGDVEGASQEQERVAEMDRYDRDMLARTLQDMGL